MCAAIRRHTNDAPIRPCLYVTLYAQACVERGWGFCRSPGKISGKYFPHEGLGLRGPEMGPGHSWPSNLPRGGQTPGDPAPSSPCRLQQTATKPGFLITGTGAAAKEANVYTRGGGGKRGEKKKHTQ